MAKCTGDSPLRFRPCRVYNGTHGHSSLSFRRCVLGLSLIHIYEDIYGEEGHYWYWIDPENNIAGLSQDTFYAEYPEFAPVDEYGPTQWGPTLPILKPTPQNRYGESLGYTEMGIDNVIQFSLPMMAEYQTNLTNLKDTWMIDFITGAKDVDADWDAYIAEMNASGLEEMVQEARDWYNANNQGEAAAE